MTHHASMTSPCGGQESQAGEMRHEEQESREGPAHKQKVKDPKGNLWETDEYLLENLTKSKLINFCLRE